MVLDLRIGANVECQDGRCGRLSRLVVDPHTGRVTDVIVERGALFPTDRVVPVAAINASDEDGVYLDMSQDDVARMAEFHDEEFHLPATNVPHADDEYPVKDDPGRVVVRSSPVAWQYPRPVVPMIAYHVHEGIPGAEIPLRRGTPVRTWREEVGRLDHVLVDRASGRITHLVVDRGFFAQAYLVPIEVVDEIAESRILLKISERELREGPQYALRSREDTLKEVLARLKEMDISEEAVEAEWHQGTLALRGNVASVETKRQIEAVLRSVPGVIAIENELCTPMGIQARVRAALAEDRHTDLARIDVLVDGGVVTLTGIVDNERVRDAAEAIAASQRGVTEVVNDLDVARDDWSDNLIYRTGWDAAREPGQQEPGGIIPKVSGS